MIPQTTPNKGNGSVIDYQSVSQSQSMVSQRDDFVRNLERTEKPVTDNLLQYPLDLFKTPEYRFGIRFDIYDASGQVLSENRSLTRATEDIASNAAVAAQVAKENANDFTSSVEMVSKQFGSAGASVASGVGSVVGGLFNFVKTTSKPFDSTGRDSFVESVVGVKSPQNKVASIYMYLPGQLSFVSNFDYEDADMSSIDVIRSLQGAMGFGTPEAQGEVVRRLSLGAVKSAGDALFEGGGDLASNFNKIQNRQVENPFLVHLFKGVQRRSFKFDFVMIPRSEQEAKNVTAIVQTFRKYAHPARSPGGRFLDFPAEFDLTFIYVDEQSGKSIAVPKIRKCAIKGISVDYGENIFSAHGGEVAQPTQVKMSLDLSELSILARQEIESGY